MLLFEKEEHIAKNKNAFVSFIAISTECKLKVEKMTPSRQKIVPFESMFSHLMCSMKFHDYLVNKFILSDLTT